MSSTKREDSRSGAGNEVTVRVVADGGRRRRMPSFGSIVATLAVGALAFAMFLGIGVVTGLVDIGNPFDSTTVDRSQPAILHEMRNLSKYTAAQGRFAQTIDVEDDVSILPSFIAGERTVFLAEGHVDATVDFSSLGADAIQTAPDGHLVVTLPEPELERAVIDPHKSHVASRSRGLLDRLGAVFSDNPTSERSLYLLAQKKLDAAARHSKLVTRAETNTTAMLQQLLAKLGHPNAEVVFAPSPASLG